MLHNTNTISGFNVLVDGNMVTFDHEGKQDANNDAFDTGSCSERRTNIFSDKTIWGMDIIDKLMTYIRIVFNDEKDIVVRDHYWLIQLSAVNLPKLPRIISSLIDY